MNQIILHVRDSGDPNVGLPESHYEIQTPFTEGVSDEDERYSMDMFKIAIHRAFAEISIGKITAIYSTELKQMEREMSDES